MSEREKFIKYLDGQMSEKEEKKFEHLLDLDPRINNKFKNFKDIFKLSKSEIETDSRYFSTLIPRVKKRNESYVPNTMSKKIIWVPTIIAVLLILIIPIIFVDTENSTILDIEEYLFSSEGMNQYLISESFEMTENYTLSNTELEELYFENLEIDESLFNFIENNLSPSDIDEEIYEIISESEFSSIYKEFEKKKIL